MANIGQNLKKLRISHNLTQAELAANLGLSKSTIVQYENNQREPNFNAILRICKYFNIVNIECLIDTFSYPYYNYNVHSNNIDEHLDKYSTDIKKITQTLTNDYTQFLESVLNPIKIGTYYNENYLLELLNCFRKALKILTIIFQNELDTNNKYRSDYTLSELALYKILTSMLDTHLYQLNNILKEVFKSNFDMSYNTMKEYSNPETLKALDEFIISVNESRNL